MTPPSSQRQRLYLAPQVFMAEVNGALVFLDQKRDSYSYVGCNESKIVLASLRGHENNDLGRFDLVLAELEKEGLLIRSPCEGKEPDPCARFAGSIEVHGPRIDEIPRIKLRHIINFLISYARSILTLRLHGFDAAIRGLQARRRGREVPSGAKDGIASQLVEIYHRIKPFFFSSTDQCLKNSLVMAHFLAAYGVYPSWVFGVRLEPFEAHCWLEDQDYLYNDHFARIDDFTPIMKA